LFPGLDDDVTEGRGVERLLILERRRKVDAVVFADVTDSLRRELLGLRTDAHGIEDMPSGLEIPAEGSV
jgi:hypothetical protein